MKVEWTPLKEQKPPKNQILMITDNKGNIVYPIVYLKNFFTGEWNFFTWDEEDCAYVFYDEDSCVVAWIEAPEPYKKRGE